MRTNDKLLGDAYVVVDRPGALVCAEDEVVVDGVEPRADHTIDDVGGAVPRVLSRACQRQLVPVMSKSCTVTGPGGEFQKQNESLTKGP